MNAFTVFRSLLLTLVLTVFHCTLAARAGDPLLGVQFFNGTWSQLLAEAKKQNKPIFIDVYTTWCGPCKLMAKQAFPDKIVGDLFNASFINYQIDAEKGEGITIAKQYAITAYPTSLFVSADGSLIQRTVGYSSIKGLLNEANKAVEAAKDPKPITVWDKEFTNGNHSAAFLKEYLAKRAKLGMPNAEALELYMASIPEPEWTIGENIDILCGNLTTSSSKAFDALLVEAKGLSTGTSRIENFRRFMETTESTIERDERQAKTEAELEQLIGKHQTMNKLFSETVSEANQKALANDVRLRYYRGIKNLSKYREVATAFATDLMAVTNADLVIKDSIAYEDFQRMTSYMEDSIKNTPVFKREEIRNRTTETQNIASRLNSLAWAYFEIMSDPADLNRAVVWSARSLELNHIPAMLDTYAQLMGRLGRKTEAIKYEEEAIARAKAFGDDAGDYEKNLAILKR